LRTGSVDSMEVASEWKRLIPGDGEFSEGTEVPLTESAKLTLMGEIGLLTSADIDWGYRSSSIDKRAAMSVLVVWSMLAVGWETPRPRNAWR
jgi:hypothetical protein